MQGVEAGSVDDQPNYHADQDEDGKQQLWNQISEMIPFFPNKFSPLSNERPGSLIYFWKFALPGLPYLV